MENKKQIYYRQTRTQRQRRRTIFVRVFIVTLVFLISSGSWSYWRYANALTPIAGSITYTPAPLPQTPDVAWPSYGQAAIATKEFGVLETHGVQDSVPTASTAKLITVLAVLESKRISPGETGPKITVTAKDIAILNGYIAKNGSVVPIAEGEQLTEYQMIQGILIASGNNLADSLAVWAFGSLENYTGYANQMIEAYGLKNTVVGVDASGLSPTTISTAHDLAIIAQKALRNPIIAEIVQQKQAVLPGVGLIRSTNKFLGTNDVIGLKTGNTDEAGGVLILAAKHSLAQQQNTTIITVIMGAPDISAAFVDSGPLLSSAKANLISGTLINTGDIVGTYTTPWDNKKYSAVSTRSIGGALWKPAASQPKISLEPSTAPLELGSTVGLITLQRVDGVELKSEIRLSAAIEPPSIAWRVLR